MYVSVLCDSKRQRERDGCIGDYIDWDEELTVWVLCASLNTCVCVCVCVVAFICLCECMCLYKKCAQAAAAGEFVFWRCVPDRVCYKQAFLCVRVGGARLKNCEGV